MDLVPPQRTGKSIGSQMAYQGEDLQFPGARGDPAAAMVAPPRKPRTAVFPVDNEKQFSVDSEGRLFRTQGAELQRCMYGSPSRIGRNHRTGNQEWNAEGSNGTPSGDDGSNGEEDDDDDDEEEDDVDEGDGEVEGVALENGNNKNHNNSSGSVQSSSENIHHEKVNLQEHHSSFGSNRGVPVKDGDDNNFLGSFSAQQGQVDPYDNAITVAEPGMYYGHIPQGEDRPSTSQKEMGGENGCGYRGRKDFSFSVECGESVRTLLSDPITGALMDDAMILSCGHSFGSTGMQHVIRMKSCFKCAQPVPEGSVRPNLALRSAVEAFRQEEELQYSKLSKRRRDRFEHDKCNYDDSFPIDLSKGKGVQFPFAVSDRVIVKGNKRTPERFVGRVAVVTTQCLNGWYVVKTLDNAESVKLQYRSLAKVTDDPSSNMISSKAITPNWP